MAARTSLRSRLVWAMVLVTIGTLGLSAGITVVYSQVAARRAAYQSAQRDLQQRAPEIAQAVGALQDDLTNRGRNGTTNTVPPAPKQAVRRLLQGALRLTDGTLVYVTPRGQLSAEPGGGGQGGNRPPTAQDLPAGVEPAQLDVAALQAGQQQSGRSGSYVWVAQPLPPMQNDAVPVVVISRDVAYRPVGGAGMIFIVVAIIAIAGAVAVSMWLARRLTRPVKQMDATAQRLAQGDLSARVDLGSHPDDELADLARALNGMAAQLDAARGQERAFLMSVSHDLRTPLTSIRGYAEAIVDGTVTTDDERVRAAKVIEAESLRLDRLVADLLDLARLDAREFSFHPTPCDAGDVVATTVAGFVPKAEELGITLTCTPGALPADVDSTRLAQIVANLTENALKYAATTVVVQAVGHDRTLSIAVDDDGPGIDPTEIDRIFDRLYTSRTTPGRTVGTGLGLAIVRELSNAMGGSVRAERLQPTGTRIAVALPVLTS